MTSISSILTSMPVQDSAQKSKVVDGFFKGITPSFYSRARSEKQISELILSYSGDIESIEKTQLIYDHVQLQKESAKSNREDPLKSKPLRVISMDSSTERETVRAALGNWWKTADEQYNKYYELYDDACSDDSSPEKQRELGSQFIFFGSLKSLISEILKNKFRSDSMAAVIDNDDRIQAVSVSHPDDEDPNAWYVEAILTAPHNFSSVDNDKNPWRVKGAGSALIEDAILKSIKRQKLSTEAPLSIEAMKNTVVVLDGASSMKFYLNLFFEIDHSRKLLVSPKILKGENLFQFLKEYGGRAKIES